MDANIPAALAALASQIDAARLAGTRRLPPSLVSNSATPSSRRQARAGRSEPHAAHQPRARPV